MKLSSRAIKFPFILSFFFCLFPFTVVQAGIQRPPPSPSPSLPPASDNQNYVSLGEALFTACSATLSSAFSADCNAALNAASSGSVGALNPDEIIANNTNITSSAVNDIFSRLNILRTGPKGGGASADSIVSGLGVYTNGHTSWQEYNPQGLNPGFDFFDSKIMLGIDYRISDYAILGLSSSYLNSDSRLKQGAGDIETDGYAFALYGSLYLEDVFFIDGTFAYADQRHRTLRTINYTGVSQQANADVDSDTYSAGLVSGYNFNYNAWTLTPTVRWMYRKIQMEQYTESLSTPSGAGGSLGLAIGEQRYESMTGSFGTQISYAWSQTWGVLIPTVSAEYIHEFSNNPETVNVRFINAPDGTGTFSLRSSVMDRDYVSVSAGFSAQFIRGVSAFVSYEKLLDLNNLTSDSLSMGLRVELD